MNAKSSGRLSLSGCLARGDKAVITNGRGRGSHQDMVHALPETGRDDARNVEGWNSAMLTEEIKAFIAGIHLAVVATADNSGHPHLALGSDFTVLDDEHIIFENWFCHKTLANVNENPRVALAVMRQDTGTGYQFVGVVTHGYDTAILDGYIPGESSHEPQTLTRLVVRVEEILAFCSGIHTDAPLGI